MAAAVAAPLPVAFPPGTVIPIRFLGAVTSGRDTVGTPVLVQTFGALVRDSCVVVPAFAELSGHVARSIGGRRLGRSGQLGIAFDSLEVRPGLWSPVRAVLDTLEYAPRRDIQDSGVVRPRSSRLPLVAAAAGAAIDFIPAAVFGGYALVHRGKRATILTGEIGAVRLLDSLVVPNAPACHPVTTPSELRDVPPLPPFTPYAVDKHGERRGDAINLIFVGRDRDLDSAFRRAGWVMARRPSVWALTREVTAMLTSRPAIGAPVSTLYFGGRREDLTYELEGPNARIRHHVRIWLLDSLTGVWVGAATKDVGVRFSPLHRIATHRIDPEVDRERDLIARTLESAGCADLLDYLHLPGADTVGHTIDGQRFTTDARSAVIRLHACPDSGVSSP